jgi:hypothetical protein
MSKKRYTKVQTLLPQIQEMLAEGRSHKEIERYFQLEGDRPIHELLKRERRKERKVEAGIPLCRQGRQPKGAMFSGAEKEYEIKRLKMENELLRDFLRAAGRK